MLHVLPPNVTTAVDLREHLHRAHLERLERMNAKAVTRPPSTRVVSRARVIGAMIYAVPVGPKLPPPPWAGFARLVYRDPIGPVHAGDRQAAAAGKPTADSIMREVCSKWGVRKADLISKRRKVKFAMPRFEACFRIRRETSLSFPQIGHVMGGRHHASIIHAVRKWEFDYRHRAIAK